MTHTTVIHLRSEDLDSTLFRPHCRVMGYANWSKFVAVCRLLHRDGVEYRVTIQPHARSILIQGRGQVRTKRLPKPSYSIPNPPNEVQARKALTGATATLAVCRTRLVEKWSWWRGTGYPTPAWDTKRHRTKRVWGRWLASRLAHRPRGFRDVASFIPNATDYKSGDETFGHKLPRLSQLNTHERESLGWATAVARRLNVYFTWRHGYKPKGAPADPTTMPEKTPRLTQPEWVKQFLLVQAQAQESYDPLRKYQLAKAEVEYWRQILRLLEGRNGNQGQA